MGLCGNIPHKWGSWGPMQRHSIPLVRKPWAENTFLGPESCHLETGVRVGGWGGGVGKVITSSSASEIIFFGLMVCWNFSGNQDFHRGSLIHGWLFKTVFSRSSETMTKRDQNQFTGHLFSEAHVDASLLAYVLYPTAPTDTFVRGWMLNCCWGETKTKDVFVSHDADVSPRVLFFSSNFLNACFFSKWAHPPLVV